MINIHCTFCAVKTHVPFNLNQWQFLLASILKTDGWIPEGSTLVVGRYVVKQTKSRVTSVNKRMSTIGVAIQVILGNMCMWH